MDILTENGIIAPRRGQPLLKARAHDCGIGAPRGSEGPSGRGLEGVEQRKGRKSRKGRWREGKRKERKDEAEEGLEERGRLRSHSNATEIRTGWECPVDRILHLEQRVTPEAQACDTDSREIGG